MWEGAGAGVLVGVAVAGGGAAGVGALVGVDPAALAARTTSVTIDATHHVRRC